jgi:hypothetical protein
MTTQSVQIQTYDFGASLSDVTLRNASTDALVATADACPEISADSGVYVAAFDEQSVIPAGVYRLRAVVSGSPINRFVTLTGVDGELAFSRVEKAAVLDSATSQKIDDILTDTGTTLPGLIGDIEGGGGTVNVLPATGITADRSAGITLTPVVGETISQAITVYQTDGTTPVDLSGKTLAIIFETMAGADVAVVSSGSVTISGDDNNVVTFAYPSAVTAAERVLRFAIRDAASPLTMYLQGYCSVVNAPKVDA